MLSFIYKIAVTLSFVKLQPSPAPAGYGLASRVTQAQGDNNNFCKLSC